METEAMAEMEVTRMKMEAAAASETTAVIEATAVGREALKAEVTAEMTAEETVMASAEVMVVRARVVMTAEVATVAATMTAEM